MAERLNIWGKEGCELPSGKLCNACCILPDIELEGTIVSVGKPANSPCPNLSIIGEGCSLHQKGKPETCKSWNCGRVDLFGKLDLIAEGLSQSLVNETEAVTAASNLLDGTANPDGIIRFGVLDEAIRLSNITSKKELTLRELNEP